MPKILIVDDDVDLVEIQRLFLVKKGYTVESAGSLQEALRKLSSFRPDLILADLMMEHYDSGFVLSRKVKEDPELAGIPILLQTAAADRVGVVFDAADSEARGWLKVEEVLHKPVPFEHLLGKVEQYLARGRSPKGSA